MITSHIYPKIIKQTIQVNKDIQSNISCLNVDNFSKKNNAIGDPTSQVITNWDTTKGTTLGQRGATRDKSHWAEV